MKGLKIRQRKSGLMKREKCGRREKEKKPTQTCSRTVSNQILAQTQELVVSRLTLDQLQSYIIRNHRRAAESYQSTYYIYLSCCPLKSQQEVQYVLSPPIIAFRGSHCEWDGA